MPGLEPRPRQEYQFSLTTTERGRSSVKMVDRLTVDDIFTNLVEREIYSLVTRLEVPFDVNDNFRAFLLKERFTAR
jgi:hypothetical protein